MSIMNGDFCTRLNPGASAKSKNRWHPRTECIKPHPGCVFQSTVGSKPPYRSVVKDGGVHGSGVLVWYGHSSSFG